ncbi:MAG: pantoate--beta-alanine ligase [Oscillospiraceae bacterium]|jgi:pantoate--beta-alanine ligase
MKLIESESELRRELEQLGKGEHRVGLVPTMGCLHEGHLSLIRKARQQNDIVVVSVFVNPTQFGPGEDYASYPRTLENDCVLAESAGADIVFHPDAAEIYSPDASTKVEVEGEITHTLCGASRPIHFKGVTTIVSILFNIVRPDRAYFGQKDAQQAVVIRKMVRELHIPVEIVVCPIVREADGLALSSRNRYLNSEERRQAVCLYRGLDAAASFLSSGAEGGTDPERLKQVICEEIDKSPLAKREYIEIVDAETLKPLRHIEKGHPALAAVAVRFGETRLIDNIILRS